MSDRLHRILIVDDDIDCLANLSDILHDAGFEVETATDGKIALDKVKTLCSNGDCQFDLCLLDFKMPEMDGVELIKQLQSKDPNLPSIMITAHSSEDGVQRACAAGTWKVLSKPVDIKLLLDLIDRAMAK